MWPNQSGLNILTNVGDAAEQKDNKATDAIAGRLSIKIRASQFQNRSVSNQRNPPESADNLKTRTTITEDNQSNNHSVNDRLTNSASKISDAIHITGSHRLNQRVVDQHKVGLHQNNPNERYQAYHAHEMAARTMQNNDDYEKDRDCSSSGDDDEEEDEDTEDYTSNLKNETETKNNNDRPKPGRLDLSQFDNITSALAKLNVQPPHKPQAKTAAQKSIVTSSRFKNNNSSPWKISKRNIPTAPDHCEKLDSSETDSTGLHVLMHQNNPRRPLNNQRKNHGRPVAPPRLPDGLVSSCAPSSSMALTSNLAAENETTSDLKACVPDQGRIFKGSTINDESTIDYSQSPIAQRLLRNSKDHKVSELNSPYENEPDVAMLTPRAAPRAYPRAQDLFKAAETPRAVSVTIKPYHRQHSIEPSELISSRGETIRQLNEILARPPSANRPGNRLNRSTQPNNHDNEHISEQQRNLSQTTGSNKQGEKESKKDKKRDEKLEKRKLKEEGRLRKLEEEKQKRQEKKLASKKSKPTNIRHDSVCDDGIPLFMKRCIEFIEAEGLDAEGIYRVPGNRAHVDTFLQKFKDNPQMSILESDIPVNAVATALKDFLSKKLGPIIPPNLMDELTELSNFVNKDQRKVAIRDLVRRLPSTNYNILKYVFLHFVKVSMNNNQNSMDSKNIAICWWPTLLPLQFNDMNVFERMRPHLEESVQTMIDQYDYIFDCVEAHQRSCDEHSQFYVDQSLLDRFQKH